MPTVTGIDHVILAVQNLDLAAEGFTRTLGLHVSGGGTHPAFGTINRIVVLGDEYIELISLQGGTAARGWLAEMLASGRQGCAGFALATGDPRAAAATMRERGLSVDGPAPGRLDTGDRYSRGWEVVRLVQPPIEGLPFLIRHETAGEERRLLLGGRVGLAPHSLGATRITALTVAVPDMQKGIDTYRRCFDLEPAEGREDRMLGAKLAELPLASGAIISLAAPATPGQGPIAQHLATRGAGLFAITLAVEDLQGAVTELRGRGIGVRVEEPNGILVSAQLNHQQTFGARLGLVAAHP